MTATEGSSDWFGNTDFWRDFGPLMFDQGRMRGTPAEVDAVLGLLELEGGAVLDLCCCPGRHVLELARRGFTVTGVDLDAAFIDQGRVTAAGEGLDAEFLQLDAREFVRPSSFDAALSMYTSFGYFQDLYDDRRVLANLHASLREGGVLLIETMGKEAVALSFRRRNWYYPADFPDDIFLLENHVVGAWERLDMHWKIIRPDGTRSEQVLSVRLYSALEMASLLRDAGFSEVGIFGDLEGSPYNEDASILVAVARK